MFLPLPVCISWRGKTICIAIHFSMKAIVSVLILANNLQDIIYNQHLNNEDIIENLLAQFADLDKEKLDYLIGILVGIIPSVFSVWYKHGKKDSADELLYRVKDSIVILSNI